MKILPVKELEQLSIEEVEAIHEEAIASERELSLKLQGRGNPYLRIFSRMRQFGAFLKVKMLKNELLALKRAKVKEQDDKTVDKLIWQCQRKGFISPETKDEITQIFTKHLSHMMLLGLDRAFAIRLVSKETGSLELIVFSEDSCKVVEIDLRAPVGVYSIEGKQYETIDSLIAEVASRALPLTQLQDISLWLEMHGSALQPLSHSFVEAKLTSLLKSCPTGAYVLYPSSTQNFCLSRLLKHGEIHHFVIDLQKKPGCFTFDISGKSYIATRSEFKRKLEMMGTPLRIHVQ